MTPFPLLEENRNIFHKISFSKVDSSEPNQCQVQALMVKELCGFYSEKVCMYKCICTNIVQSLGTRLKKSGPKLDFPGMDSIRNRNSCKNIAHRMIRLLETLTLLDKKSVRSQVGGVLGD